MNAKSHAVDYGVRHAFQRVRVQFTPRGHSLTKQAFREECDINSIMRRFERDGILAHYNTYRGEYGDFTDCPEYHEAQNKVLAANEMFMSVPAVIRDRFANDPGKFLEFVSDPKNLPEMRKLGLAKEPPPVQSTSKQESAPDVKT